MEVEFLKGVAEKDFEGVEAGTLSAILRVSA